MPEVSFLLVTDARTAAAQPASDAIERHVPAVPVCQLILVEYDAPVARLAERAEGERPVVSEGAEDDGWRLSHTYLKG